MIIYVFMIFCAPNLSSAASPALTPTSTSILFLLRCRATLHVDFQHWLVHKLGWTVKTCRWLLVCNGKVSCFRQVFIWLIWAWGLLDVVRLCSDKCHIQKWPGMRNGQMQQVFQGQQWLLMMWTHKYSSTQQMYATRCKEWTCVVISN